MTPDDTSRNEKTFLRLTSFFVSMKPKAKARPRFTRKGFAYTPSSTASAEKTISLIAKQVFKKEPTRKPVKLVLKFYFQTPKSWTNKKRKLVFEDNAGFHSGKPDLDNLSKLVKDSLNGIIFHDDAVVACMYCEKRYDDRIEGISIEVYEYGDTDDNNDDDQTNK